MSLCSQHPDERGLYVLDQAWAKRNQLPRWEYRQYYACRSCMDATEDDVPNVTFLWQGRISVLTHTNGTMEWTSADGIFGPTAPPAVESEESHGIH